MKGPGCSFWSHCHAKDLCNWDPALQWRRHRRGVLYPAKLKRSHGGHGAPGCPSSNIPWQPATAEDFCILFNTRRSVFLKYKQKKHTHTQCCEVGEFWEVCTFDEENCVCICFSLASALRDLVLKYIWYTSCELSRKKMLQWWNVHLAIAHLINQWSSKNSLPMPKVDDQVFSRFLPSAEFSSEDWHDQSCTHYNTISISPFLALHIFSPTTVVWCFLI